MSRFKACAMFASALFIEAFVVFLIVRNTWKARNPDCCEIETLGPNLMRIFTSPTGAFFILLFLTVAIFNWRTRKKMTARLRPEEKKHIGKIVFGILAYGAMLFFTIWWTIETSDIFLTIGIIFILMLIPWLPLLLPLFQWNKQGTLRHLGQAASMAALIYIAAYGPMRIVMHQALPVPGISSPSGRGLR